jgi:hypothetical protein
MVGSPRPQLVRDGERVVEPLEVGDAGERRHLVHDCPRLRTGDRLSDRARVEAVHQHGLGAERAKPLELVGAPRRGYDLVAVPDKLWHQPSADRTASSWQRKHACRAPFGNCSRWSKVMTTRRPAL